MMFFVLILYIIVESIAVVEYPYLAPLLVLNNGSRVDSKDVWMNERRDEVGRLLQSTILGTLPETPPRFVGMKEINRTTYSNAQCLHVKLMFSSNLSFVVEVMIPNDVANAPIFLTQGNHRGWAQVGLSRGYVSIVYPGGDTNDAAPMFQKAYESEASMMLIMARAFVVSRVVDFIHEGWDELTNVPSLNTSQICITGHSRNGKQSLIAAAFDERVTAVVGSSPGAPIASPYTFSSHNFYGEGPDAGVAGKWWLENVEKYVAHPETLPMDGHGVLAMIAPRHVMISNAYTDHEGEVSFADEMNFITACQVFELFNASSSVRLSHRPGDHHGFIDVQSYFDFFDFAFERSTGHDESSNLITPASFDFENWLETYGSDIPSPPSPSSSSFEDRVDWVTQYRSGEIAIRSVGSPYSESGIKGNHFSYISVMMMNDFDRDDSMYRLPVSFGRYVTANVYWPTSSSVDKELDAVIWLHPYSYASGYVSTYGENSIVQDIVHESKRIVVAFDQIGFGTRVRQGGQVFYDRHGSRASLFGHMIQDVFHAVDFLTCRKAAYRTNQSMCRDGEIPTSTYPFTLDQIPNVGSITVAGYSLGGNVALHAASLDDRIDSVASFAGFTPYRTDTNDRSTYGIRRLYDLHALLPRLGLFRDDPSKIPYDYDEVLSNIAPRPTLIHAPTQDRDANFIDVQSCVNKARSSWGIFSGRLNFSSSIGSGMTQMSINESKLLCDWLEGV